MLANKSTSRLQTSVAVIAYALKRDVNLAKQFMSHNTMANLKKNIEHYMTATTYKKNFWMQRMKLRGNSISLEHAVEKAGGHGC